MRSYIYDGLVTQYQISETGELYNTLTKNYPKGWINSQGYRMYYVNINGIKKTMYAHRMVAETYIPHNSEQDCVNHKDGNKLNNNINNLEWVTKKENNRHAVKNNLNPLYKKVYCYDKNKVLVCIYESIQAASKITGFSENSISAGCQSIKKNLIHGYYWNFIDDNSFETYVATNHGGKKPVAKYSLNNELLEEYESIKQASELTHFPRTRISDCANGRINSYGGYIWKFI